MCTNHVSFEFSVGYKFADPEKVLEGKGKYRRQVKLRSLDDIDLKNLELFLKQSKEVEM